jgi:hypothetical protein
VDDIIVIIPQSIHHIILIIPQSIGSHTCRLPSSCQAKPKRKKERKKEKERHLGLNKKKVPPYYTTPKTLPNPIQKSDLATRYPLKYLVS